MNPTSVSEKDNKNFELAEEVGKIWKERVEGTRQLYETWERRFHCKRAYDFYEGHQWRDTDYYRMGGMNYLPYTLNLFYSTVETRLPSLTFDNPSFLLTPKPGKEALDYSNPLAMQTIKMRQDAINTLIQDPDFDFMNIMETTILDAHFRFGVVEIGISDSWTENPNLTKPALKSDSLDSSLEDTEPSPENVLQENQNIREEELVYVKHIPAAAFRVNAGSRGNLRNCDWCAYYEYYRREDLASQESFHKVLSQHGSLSFSDGIDTSTALQELQNQDAQAFKLNNIGDYVLVLHLFDNRLKVRYFIDCANNIILGQSDFPGKAKGQPRLPIEDLRFSKSLRYWYGVPPASQWLSPQIEYNEERERLRGYARKMLRKYIFRVDMFDNEQEIDKLMNGVDGVFAAVKGDLDQVVRPLPVPPIAPETIQSAGMAREDFDIASGVSSLQRGQADRQTATQSRIIDQRTTIRESRQANIVANFMCRIARQISLCQSELSEQFWIKVSPNPQNSLTAFANIEQQTDGSLNPNLPSPQFPEYQLISSEQLGDFDFNLQVQLETISPLANELRKNAFLEFLALINQYPQFGLSPILIAELADKVGFRNTAVIQEFQQLALLQQIGIQAQAAAASGQSPMAERTVNNATPSANEQVTNQLNNQVGLPTDLAGAS